MHPNTPARRLPTDGPDARRSRTLPRQRARPRKLDRSLQSRPATAPTKAAAALGLALLLAITAAAADPEAWVPLFDGTTLSGWHRAGFSNGQAEYTVADGSIVGTTRTSTPNSFLCSDATYANFILEFEFMVPAGMNSGVQIRSICDPQINNGRVHGYQVEIDPSARAWTGGIYDEGRRGWLYNLTHLEKERGQTAAEAARRAFKADAWNHLRVEANGPRLRTWLNGVPVADLHDTLTPVGIIALQVHATPDPLPKQIRWRNLRLLKPADTGIDDEAWTALRTWRYAEPRAALLRIENDLRGAQGAAWLAREVTLLRLLQDTGASLEARRFACAWLGRRGTPAAVPNLAGGLANNDLFAPALAALARLPYPASTAVLLAASAQPLAPADLAALLTVLGERRATDAVPDLARCLAAPDAAVRRAALGALGRIGTPAAEEALRQAAPPADLLPRRADALLDCAEQARRDGDSPRAERICRELLAADPSETGRTGALTVLADTIGAGAVPEILTALTAGSEPQRAVAARLLGTLPGDTVCTAALATLPHLPAPLQVIILKALAVRPDPDTIAAATVVDLLKSPDNNVRAAAVCLLQRVGGAAEVPALVEIAAARGDLLAPVAQQALATLRGDGVDPALAAATQRNTPSAQRGAALTALGQRGYAQSVEIALEMIASTQDADAQRTYWRILRDLTEPEHLAPLLRALARSPDGPVRAEAEKTTAECLRRTTAADAATQEVLTVLAAAPPAARPTLTALLAVRPGSTAATALMGLLQDPDANCRYEAAKALESWPSAEPYAALRTYAAATDLETHHVLALRGCIRMLDLDKNLSETDRGQRLDDLATGARRDAERDLIRAARDTLRVSDLKATSGRAYALRPRGLAKGSTVYVDRPYTFTDVPALLADAILIQTAMDDKASSGTAFLTFTLSRPATVIVGYDGRAKGVPNWLKDWQRLEPVIKTTDAGCPLTLFTRPFPAGNATLPGNNSVQGVGAMYIAAVVPDTPPPPAPAPAAP